MTISIIFTSEAARSDAYSDMYGMLRTCIAADHVHDISDVNPDIVHLFGAFDRETSSLLTRYRKLCIPVVLTVCNALAAFTRHGPDIHQSSMHLLPKRILRKASAVVATGQQEAWALETAMDGRHVKEVRNAAVTGTVSAETMTEQLLRIYGDTVEQHEQHVQQDIAKTVSSVSANLSDTIRMVCALILYARYLNNRGQLTASRLSQMAQLLVSSDYDEDLLARILSKLHLKTFTARLLAYMEDNSLITEGFMPIPRAPRPLSVNTVDKSCIQAR